MLVGAPPAAAVNGKEKDKKAAVLPQPAAKLSFVDFGAAQCSNGG